MSSDLSRETKGDAAQGIPWQIIYASFLGETLCAFSLYGAFWLLGAKLGWMGLVGGLAALLVAVALGVAFAALLTGARWAVSVARVFALASALVFLVLLARAFLLAGHSLAWKFLDTRTWWLLSDMLFDPPTVLTLGGGFVTAAMTCFLFGDTSRRFFGR
jgi:hypothetical protein